MSQSKLKFTILFLCCISARVFSQDVKQIFISPTGNDKATGTIDKPFATIEKARKVVRTILLNGKNSSITVYLRAGNYILNNSVVFNSLDSGTDNYPVTYSAYNNETVSLSGGRSIPIKSATPVKDMAVLERFPGAAKNNVLQINLKNQASAILEQRHPMVLHGLISPTIGIKFT